MLERLGERYAEGAGAADAALARETFLAQTGRVHEEDPSFDLRMTIFLEWFLLDRADEAAPTPAERYLKKEGGALSPDDRGALFGLCNSHRSLFCYAGRDRGGRFRLEDLLAGIRWAAEPPPHAEDFEPGDVFDARLVGLGGAVHFSTGFCYHPREVAPRIRRYAGRVRGTRPGREVLGELMTMRLHYDRAQAEPLDEIYRL